MTATHRNPRRQHLVQRDARLRRNPRQTTRIEGATRRWSDLQGRSAPTSGRSASAYGGPYGPSPRIDHPDSTARHPCRLITPTHEFPPITHQTTRGGEVANSSPDRQRGGEHLSSGLRRQPSPTSSSTRYTTTSDLTELAQAADRMLPEDRVPDAPSGHAAASNVSSSARDRARSK